MNYVSLNSSMNLKSDNDNINGSKLPRRQEAIATELKMKYASQRQDDAEFFDREGMLKIIFNEEHVDERCLNIKNFKPL